MTEYNYRLTEWVSYGDTGFAIPARGYTNGEQKCINKLARYEDLEEEGRLLELPCSPGELVWIVDGNETKPGTYASKADIIADIEKGISIGYTKEVAEAKFNIEN